MRQLGAIGQDRIVFALFCTTVIIIIIALGATAAAASDVVHVDVHAQEL